MALSLGISVGSRIQIGDKVMTVVDALRGRSILVEVEGLSYVITDQCKVEVLPGVFVFFGSPTTSLQSFNGLRLAFEAPRSIKIMRLEDAPAK